MNNAALRRPIVRAVILLFVMDLYRLFSGPPTQTALNLLLWASFSFVPLLPKVWWTKRRLQAAGLILTAESAAALLWFQEWNLIYFIAILAFSAAVHLSLSRSPLLAIAAMLVTALLYIRFGRNDLFHFVTFSLLAFVFYWTVRSRMQRNEIAELNRQHLAKLQEAYAQLQEASAVGMHNAVLEERTRIAREIHDAVGHSLTSLIVQLQALRYMIGQDAAQAEQAVEQMLVVARQGLQNIRSSVHALADDRTGLGIAPLRALLSRMEASASIGYTLESALDDGELDAELSGLLFSVLQEAVTNVIRHAEATRVEVELSREAEAVVLRVRDNGKLTSAKPVAEGFGLRAMRARVEEKGGWLRVAPVPPHGLALTAAVPAAPAKRRREAEDGGGRTERKGDAEYDGRKN